MQPRYAFSVHSTRCCGLLDSKISSAGCAEAGSLAPQQLYAAKALPRLPLRCKSMLFQPCRGFYFVCPASRPTHTHAFYLLLKLLSLSLFSHARSRLSGCQARPVDRWQDSWTYTNLPYTPLARWQTLFAFLCGLLPSLFFYLGASAIEPNHHAYIAQGCLYLCVYCPLVLMASRCDISYEHFLYTKRKIVTTLFSHSFLFILLSATL